MTLNIIVRLCSPRAIAHLPHAGTYPARPSVSPSVFAAHRQYPIDYMSGLSLVTRFGVAICCTKGSFFIQSRLLVLPSIFVAFGPWPVHYMLGLCLGRSFPWKLYHKSFFRRSPYFLVLCSGLSCPWSSKFTSHGILNFMLWNSGLL